METVHVRVNSAMTPPGVWASASMSSLLIKGNDLYIIKTGPGLASQEIYTQGLLELEGRGEGANAGVMNLVASRMAKRTAKKVKAGEAKIGDRPEDLVDGKNSFVFPTREVKVTVLDDRVSFIALELETPKKTFKFQCSSLDWEEVRTLAERLA